MNGLSTRWTIGFFAAGALAALPLAITTLAAPQCDTDNGGLTLPPGFCAQVAADNLGPARHVIVNGNGDVYIALQRAVRGDATNATIVALRDADNDGKFELKETFGTGSATGIGLRNGYLYVAHMNDVQRYKLTPGELKPAGAPETVVTGLPGERQHGDKGIAFDGQGGLYVNVGAPSNACQNPDRRPGAPGQDPCPLLEKHGGIWKFNENTLNQTQDMGTRFATGLRQMPAITWHDGALYIVMNNRDQIDTFWPDKFKAEDNAQRPAEPMYRATQGSNFGWPYCYFDYTKKQLLLNPEYGGDGATVGRCKEFTDPVASFPPHWAPLAVTFYNGTQFPAKYRGGAFIAFHGSWNRAPEQAGYNVTFQPFANGKPSGAFEVFADGFAGKAPLVNPGEAMYRADGVAVGTDGSLFITDSQKGRVWRVFYKG